jgi:uncharacterized membrane protein
MNSLFNRLYFSVGVLFLLAFLMPVLIQAVAILLPLVLIIGLVVVVVRLVWFYTSRY